jgi:DNA polymerase III delta subunit
MNYFLHGDYHLQSRIFLLDLIDKAKELNKEVIELNGEKIDLNELIQATMSNSLFGGEKVIVIENLFSRRKSTLLDDILNWLKNYEESNELIFWEKKKIGKVAQRKLPKNITVKEFKTPVIVFKLVDLLSPKNKKQTLIMLEKALITDPAEFLFVMIARQIRLMIMAKGGEKLKGAPWMIGKWKKQASEFEMESLINSYQKLYKIDKEIKTGKTLMPLAWHLTMWVSEL